MMSYHKKKKYKSIKWSLYVHFLHFGMNIGTITERPYMDSSSVASTPF